MNFRLTNIRTAKSRNGLSMSAILFVNDIKTAAFIDDGNGGLPSFDVFDKALFAELESKVNELPEMWVPEYEMNIKIDMGFFIDLLHAAQVNRQPFKLLAA